MTTGREMQATALAAAKAASNTSSDVAAMSCVAVASLASVTIKDGISPKEFFYVNIQRFVVNALATEEQEADNETRRNSLEQAIRKEHGETGTSVTFDDNGKLVIGPATIAAEMG